MCACVFSSVKGRADVVCSPRVSLLGPVTRLPYETKHDLNIVLAGRGSSWSYDGLEIRYPQPAKESHTIYLLVKASNVQTVI